MMKKKLTVLLHISILLNRSLFAEIEYTAMIKPLLAGLAKDE